MAGKALDQESRRGEIQLGDLIRALARLRPSPGQAAQVAHCLGFALEETLTGEEPAQRPRNIPGEPVTRTRTQATPPPKPALPIPPAPPPPPNLPMTTLPSQLLRLDDVRAPAADQPADWLHDDFRLLRPESGVSPSRQPILPDALARGVFSAALATRRPGQTLDFAALLRDMSACRLRELRCLPEASLSRGCQVLLDFAESMLPWWDDLHALPTQVANVAGRHSVSVFSFDGDPNHAAGWRADGERLPWQSVAGRPVLVATDLGIPGGSRQRNLKPHWQRFADRCKAEGVPLLVLSPWAFKPPLNGLGGGVILMHWSTATSAARIRGVTGAGHKVTP